MSTRAVYTFIDDRDKFSVYKHSDGYPRGAAEFIDRAVKLAWPLPRFEASDFAAAFVAANKRIGGGDVYFTGSHRDHKDLEYRYEIRHKDGEIHVAAFRRTGSWLRVRYSRIYSGPLAGFLEFAEFKRENAWNNSWVTETVLNLAGQIVSGNTSVAPILADALEDAGCTRDDLLSSLRAS